VPPLGGPAGDRVVVDRRIAELEQVILEAGSHEQSIRLATDDLLALTHADVLDLCAD
jgi:prolyl-tRNA editing enzyme YbaK/EbsC (Cys-tRNA(Pro) deacylase)